MYFLRKLRFFVISLILAIIYYLFAYDLQRTDFNKLLLFWSILFTGYCLLISHKHKISTKSLVIISIVFRLIFLLAIPNLSQDFYRFIWDGRMLFEGFNPYLSLPQNFIEEGNFPISQAKALYEGMGPMNGSHYTNYPPLNQFCFFLASLFSNSSILGAVIVMRSIIIFADIGILYFGSALLKNFDKNPKLIFLYLLNPFIIIELTGNLHFESVMLFFFVWSLYLLQKKKWLLSAFILAFSINIKLIPLLFLPLYLKWFMTDVNFKSKKENFGKLLLFYVVVIITSITFFIPFYNPTLLANYSNSVGLWFRNFEFNASFYYIFREMGYLFRGYNEIAVIGKIMPLLTVIFLICLSIFKRNKPTKELITSMLFGLSFYYFTTTTMHPWYLATLVIISVFTNYKYPILWSFVVILSYQAYSNTPWKENLWFVAIEYIIVYCYLIYELATKTKPTQKLSGKNCYEKEKESGL